MGLRAKLGAALVLVGVVVFVWFTAFRGEPPIRVYVERTYEQDRLQLLLALQPDVKVLLQPGTEDVVVRVEGVSDPNLGRIPRATIRARHRTTGYEVHALAEFLRVRNHKGGRARWVSSYAEEVREEDVADILYQVVREAARQEHREVYRPPAEIQRALRAVEPTS